MSRQLSTSSYAVLGLLALRDWSAYELTQQARRSLRFAWPRSESQLYTEPKKLVARGYARPRKEEHGARGRTVYSITEDGREALRAWLTTSPRPPELHAEALLRVLFADQGDKADLEATLDALQADARRLHEEGREIVAGYLEGQHPLPERAHLSVLYALFQGHLYRLLYQWVDLARDEIAHWPSTAGIGLNERIRELAQELVDDESIPKSVSCSSPDP